MRRFLGSWGFSGAKGSRSAKPTAFRASAGEQANTSGKSLWPSTGSITGVFNGGLWLNSGFHSGGRG